MFRMKKWLLYIFVVLFAITGLQRSYAQESEKGSKQNVEQKGTHSHKKQARNYWYLGGEVYSPHFFGDLYSITPQKWHLGLGGQLKVGYQFSPIFALEFNVGYGQNSATALGYQSSYMLGIRDAYMYYPYTMIDGVVYSTVEDLFGEQGVHNKSAMLEGISFNKIQSNISMWQSSISTVFNLNRLFTTSAAQKEQPLVLLLKPGIYLSRFTSTIINKADGQQVAPHVNKKLTLGAGTDLAIRFNVSYNWAFEITNRFVWEHDRAIDGVLSSKQAYDDYTWQPAVALIYKLGKKEIKETPKEEQNILSFPVKTSLPIFAYSSPKGSTKALPKRETHTASISLTYPLNKTAIVPTLGNNKEELSRLEEELRNYTTNPDFIIRKITVNGLASPEGSLHNNIKLAEGRVTSIIDYVRRRSNIPHTLFSYGFLGENWDGLKETIEKSNFSNKEQILSILQNPNTEERKNELKKMHNYRVLLQTIYPSLRSSRYAVEYEIRNFTPQEARERINTAPQTLNPEEMYAVALLYPIDSEEFRKALQTLYTFHPESDLALHLRGKEAFEAKEYDRAIQLLTKIKEKSGSVLNLLAVVYANNGDTAQAKLLFQQAVVQQDHHAVENSNKLNEYLSQQQSKK